MKIKDIGKPVTARSLNESLAARYGSKIDLNKFTLEQLEDTRNKLRTKLKAVETMESFENVHNETYQKTKMFLDVLNAEISERGGDVNLGRARSRVVREGSEDEAELVMAAKQMVERLTGWMEDVAEMQTQSMLELADSIREELGSEVSEQYVNTVKPSFESLYGVMEETRKALTTGVGLLTGDAQADQSLGGEEGMDAGLEGGDEMAAGPEEPAVPGDEMDDLDDDDLDAELAADDEMTAEPRPKRESIDPRRLGLLLSKKK
jgi:hypothetical protein